MSRLRAAIRGVSLGLVTGGLFAALLVGMALLFAFRRARLRWRGLIFRRWSKAAAWLLNVKIKTDGVPPRPPFFLVANHLSYTDIFVIASQADCRFVARHDLAAVPLVGWLCRSAGTIFIDRSKRRDIVRVGGQVERALAEGSGVVIFPEGTSTAGATVLPFKPGLLELASRASFGVSYAALSYRVAAGDVPAHLSVCWWGKRTFPGHLWGLLQLREVHATLSFGREPIRAADRKALAHQLHAAVQREFIPVVNGEQECLAAIP